MIAVAELRNADTFPVITAEMGDIVHVQRSLQRAKGVGGCRIFLLKVHLTKPSLQAFVANIMAFAFADHREQWAVDLSVCQQGAGQQRKVFCLHSVLQGDAGGGDNDGLVQCLRVRPVGRRGSCQISVGLADAGACVAQGDATVQHGSQHPVAELDLLGTLRHALGRQQVFENMVDHGVGFLPVCIICIHPWISPIMIKSIFVIRFTVFAARAPVDKGNSTDRRRLPSHGRIPGVSTAFNPMAAQPHHAGQCFVSHYQPEQSQCQPTLPKSARHRFYRSPKISPPGHGAHCANAHPSGRLPVLLVCTFQGTVRDLLLGPSLSSRKSPRVNTLNLKNSQNISSDPAEYGPGV